MKLLIGLILAVCVGIGCRWFGIPLPGPPAIMGAAMAVAMASGYTATDYWLTKKADQANPTISAPAGHSSDETKEAVTVRALETDGEIA